MSTNDPPRTMTLPRLRIDLLMLAACVALFTVFPTLDLDVAALMYDPASGFRWGDAPLVQLSYQIFKAKVIGWVVIGLLLYSLAAWFGRRIPAARRRAALFLLLMIIAGPILLVNSGLKDHWGRARPIQVTQFGGERIYTPPLVPATQCDKNCSFVSGHAAAGFALIGVYWVTRRRRWLVAGIALGSAVGLGRMLQGAHFLSDIVFAFWAVYLTGAVLDRLMPITQNAPSAEGIRTENP